MQQMKKPEFPLHLFNEKQTKLWLVRADARRPMAAYLIQSRYRGGFGLLSCHLELIAMVDPRGVIRELRAPFQRFEMWMASNAPNPVEECACRNFVDPEVQGPWSQRDGKNGHHPFCQFDRTAPLVFVDAAQSANARLDEGQRPQKRPDEWLKMRETRLDS